jgi:spermidine/putrescine transport system ATP-binding protein
LEAFDTKDDVLVAIAPVDVKLIPPEESELTGVVRACMFLGTHYEVTIGCSEEDWIAYSAEYMGSGEEIGLAVPADKIAVSANEAN